MTVNVRACYHPPKPIYDTTLFREYLLEIIEGLIDNEPESVFVLTGDLNGLRTEPWSVFDLTGVLNGLRTEPGSVFVLTGDLNGLRTAELQSQLGLDQLVDKPTHCNNIIYVFLSAHK